MHMRARIYATSYHVSSTYRRYNMYKGLNRNNSTDRPRPTAACGVTHTAQTTPRRRMNQPRHSASGQAARSGAQQVTIITYTHASRREGCVGREKYAPHGKYVRTWGDGAEGAKGRMFGKTYTKREGTIAARRAKGHREARTRAEPRLIPVVMRYTGLPCMSPMHPQ